MRYFFGTLIGYKIEIISASNINYEGIKGLVVDETRNTVLIKDDNDRVYRVIKNGTVFKVYHPDGEEYVFNGRDLVGDIVRRVVEL